MSVERFAGGIDIKRQQAELMAQLERDTAQRRTADQQRMAQQTRRDVAAAYGKIIPFN